MDFKDRAGRSGVGGGGQGFVLSSWTSRFLRQEGSGLESSGAEELRFGHPGLTFLSVLWSLVVGGAAVCLWSRLLYGMSQS